MNYQHITVLGRATGDAEELKTKGSKKSFSSFSIAVNRYLGKDKEMEVNYYDCLIFGDARAEKIKELVKKGDLVAVHGRPEVEAYLSKTGEAKANVKILVEGWQVLK